MQATRKTMHFGIRRLFHTSRSRLNKFMLIPLTKEDKCLDRKAYDPQREKKRLTGFHKELTRAVERVLPMSELLMKAEIYVDDIVLDKRGRNATIVFTSGLVRNGNWLGPDLIEALHNEWMTYRDYVGRAYRSKIRTGPLPSIKFEYAAVPEGGGHKERMAAFIRNVKQKGTKLKDPVPMED
ncbi:hypothetical protein NDN08_006375 [Rhodosorus marinus]|uniref:Uncharacterized protein n=1 Tax=Rhodosorus marinus TaxID=101924 RepID=A0AAV8UKI1_9RHOD|nr:hypothetical protein NDN08_006375 [Rhodosorus marinus]